jgi:hypothetical protein
MDKAAERQETYPGLYPMIYHTEQLQVQNAERHGLGPMIDSHYEYLLKIWLSSKEKRYKDMYMQSAKALINHVVQFSPKGEHAFAPDCEIYPDVKRNIHGNRFHHLVCFHSLIYIRLVLRVGCLY